MNICSYIIRKPHFLLVDFKGTQHGLIQRRFGATCVRLLSGEFSYSRSDSFYYDFTNYERGNTRPETVESCLRYIFGKEAPTIPLTVVKP